MAEKTTEAKPTPKKARGRGLAPAVKFRANTDVTLCGARIKAGETFKSTARICDQMLRAEAVEVVK